MKNRAIVIFPEIKNMKGIHEIREKYDSLYNYIAPHITLVFPFESEISTEEMIAHVEKALEGFEGFYLSMRGVTGSPEGYIFLDVKKGNDQIIELHERLYEGILKEYHYRFIPYTPHLTLGRLGDPEKHKEAVTSLFEFNDVFEAEVKKLVVLDLGKEKATEEYIHIL